MIVNYVRAMTVNSWENSYRNFKKYVENNIPVPYRRDTCFFVFFSKKVKVLVGKFSRFVLIFGLNRQINFDPRCCTYLLLGCFIKNLELK